MKTTKITIRVDVESKADADLTEHMVSRVLNEYLVDGDTFLDVETYLEGEDF